MFIQRLIPLQKTLVSKNPTEFTNKELRSILGGVHFWNHYGKVEKPKPGFTREITGYYVIDANINPFAPHGPCKHGAAISSLVLPPEDVSKQLPLFLNDGNGLYMYCGEYSEPRGTDSIGFNEMSSIVPQEIKVYHAKQLCSKSNGRKRRPALVALKEQWPQAPLGWWDVDTKKFIEYDEDKEWEMGPPCSMPISDDQAEAIKYEDPMAAFERVSDT